ncbi:MAG: hypothetical protein ACREC0_01235 [Methylocella sp.]
MPENKTFSAVDALLISKRRILSVHNAIVGKAYLLCDRRYKNSFIAASTSRQFQAASPSRLNLFASTPSVIHSHRLPSAPMLHLALHSRLTGSLAIRPANHRE